MRENGSMPITSPPRATKPSASVPPGFPASANLAFQQNKQRVRRIALMQQSFSGGERAFFGDRNKPLQLIVSKIGEDLIGAQCPP